MQITADDSAHLAQVRDVLRMDAAFSAEVLQLANSPLLGARYEIKSILQAVAILGLERIKALTATLALRMFLTGKPSDVLQACWRRNLAVAIISERLARYVDMDRDTCYTAGLLHDIGRLALLWTSPGAYSEILTNSEIESSDLLEREKEAFGIDHCTAGEWILTEWGFPPELREVALRHHRRPSPEKGLLPVVFTARRIADVFGFRAQPHAPDLAEVVEVLPAQSRQRVLEDFEAIADDAMFRINALECSLL
jgi:putative nucleotidyltransferase with HDIG domain